MIRGKKEIKYINAFLKKRAIMKKKDDENHVLKRGKNRRKFELRLKAIDYDLNEENKYLEGLD